MKKMYIILILLFCLAQPVSAQNIYELAYAFDGDTARIVRDLKWGLMNRELNEILPPKWDFLGDCVEGRRMIRQNDLFGFADEAGNQVIAPTYVQAENFSEGLACVKNAEGLWGYINPAGSPVIPCSFAAADSFSDGLALVQSEGLYGYIDSWGQAVIAAAYEEAYPFAGGLACVKKDGLYGYIDVTGAMV
ncbi:MAG: WG repeat-containing protein, partial [Clostridia bacterium]